MVKNWMMTIPRVAKVNVESKLFHYEEEIRITTRWLRYMLDCNDVKKWIIAMEEGKGGYKHYQIRLSVSNESFFDWCKDHIPWAHLEEASDKWEYEKKEGHYWTSWELPAVRKLRFGEITEVQRRALKALRTQSERQVDVWYDKDGGSGKTWLGTHLLETGEALYIRANAYNTEAICNFIVHNWNGQRIIVIDIPRAFDPKKATGLYETIEMIKDGPVFSLKWEGSWKNVRGTKLLVCTNTKLDMKMLSKDRWRFHYGPNFEDAPKCAAAHGPGSSWEDDGMVGGQGSLS
uniref:Replication-associated protein n=1 Tax=Chrysolophus pictus Smacoviridae sp. TaxID=2814972 RepID=A0A8A4XCL2_9VIRU